MNLREALDTMYDIADIWGEFARSIRWENRFFPPVRFNLLFKSIWEKTNYAEMNVPELYRARVVTPNLIKRLSVERSGKIEDMIWGKSGLRGLPSDEMGAPPKGYASSGRVNPRGISYLYLADSPITACSEVRPILSDLISVGKFKIPSGLNFVDLRNIENSFAVKNLDGTKCEDARLIEFLNTLCNSFSEPVNREDDLGYLPSQYVAAYWKQLGADGIIFDSHMNSGNNGYNVVLFKPDLATYVENSSVLYQCTHIQSDFQNLSLSKSSPTTAKTKDTRLEWSEKAILARDINNIKRAYGGEQP